MTETNSFEYCEYSDSCTQAADWSIGFTKPAMSICRIHATVLVWKLMMDGGGDGLDRIVMERRV